MIIFGGADFIFFVGVAVVVVMTRAADGIFSRRAMIFLTALSV